MIMYVCICLTVSKYIFHALKINPSQDSMICSLPVWVPGAVATPPGSTWQVDYANQKLPANIQKTMENQRFMGKSTTSITSMDVKSPFDSWVNQLFLWPWLR